jgi:hypothetical protein
MDFTQLTAVLVWLAGPSGAAAWMVFLSNAVRNLREGDPNNMDEYQKGLAGLVRNMTPLALQTVVTVLAIGVPIAAAGVLAVIPAETLAAIQGTYSFIATLFIVYLAQQVWFQITKPKPAAQAASVVVESSASGAQRTTAQAGGTIADPKSGSTYPVG